MKQVLDDAISHVGQGSHRNEASLIVKLFRMDAAQAAASAAATATDDDDTNTIVQSFIRRAKCPMNDDINSSLVQEYQQQFVNKKMNSPASSIHQIEDARKYESKVYPSFITYEDEIEIAMHQEQIWYKDYVSDVDTDIDKEGTTTIDWEQILNNTNSNKEINCWMGLGSIQTAQAFIKYANACSHFRYADDDAGNKATVRTTIHIKHKI